LVSRRIGVLGRAALRDLAPVVFGASADGDAEAGAILHRLGDELAVMAVAIIRRLHPVRRDPEVVLAGGLFATGHAGLVERVEAGIHRSVPSARLRSLALPPVLGAVLLALDAAGAARPDAERRLRAARIALDPVATS
jgi:N-acetylglucosamine kinase-like BadF-type ATPase